MRDRRRPTLAALALLLGGLATSPTALEAAAPGAPTLAEVLSRHAAARGGADRWLAVRSIVLTGTQTTFSEPSPFRIVRARPGRYRWEFTAMKKAVVVAHDGTSGWWLQPLIAEWPTALPIADGAMAERDAIIEPPLLTAEARGDRLELVGVEDLDGSPTVAIRLTRNDGETETWYLDPASGLEVARLSPGSDFGTPMPMWTYYFDFRPASGLVMPHRVEMEYGIRHVVQEVERVEVDGAADPAGFSMPLSDGMQPLATLAGTWDVTIESRSSPRAPFSETTTVSTIEPLLGGNLLEERVRWNADGFPVAAVRSRSWDRFRKVYRFTEVDDFAGMVNVSEGTFADGRLVASNERTGTTLQLSGQTSLERTTTRDIAADGFVVESELSTDEGKTWYVAGRWTYARRPPAAAAR